MRYQELNLDGLVGPTHNYAGLSPGNLASESHRGQASSPREAALQGLEKMWLLHNLGIPQAVMPPQLCPRLNALRALGFDGSDVQMIERAWQQAPELLAACYSASSMWAANSATVTCSADSADRKVHFTPANLVFNLHRSFESEQSGYFLQRIFCDRQHFSHHPALPASIDLGDEGAANHTRLYAEQDKPGITLLTYGQSTQGPQPQLYPARQSEAACRILQRSHQLSDANCQRVQQLPASIDQGVFHNDVIAVGHRNLLLLHEEAWLNQAAELAALRQRWGDSTPLYIEQIPATQLSVEQAVSSYLFNSQLVTTGDGEMVLIAPQESREEAHARRVIEHLIVGDNPLSAVQFVDLRQSMSNGGGPACLRLRIPLSEKELAAMHQGVVLDEGLYWTLQEWIKGYYRDRLSPEDLRDPALMGESRAALAELEKILGLPDLYQFD